MAITRTMFEIFRDDSAASFYHAFRIFECLLRCFPGEVYEGICGDGRGSDRMKALLKYVGFPPIGELLVMIIALTPVSRVSQLYFECAKRRWTYFEQLNDSVFLLQITDVIVNPEKYCYITPEIDAEEHSSAASQVFQELVEKLSLEDVGEILLQPLGYSTELLDLLVNTAVTNTSSSMITAGSTSSSVDIHGENSRRRTAIQLLCFLLRRAAEPEVMCMVAGGPGNMAQPSIVANRVHPLRERIISHLETRMSDVFVMIARFASPESKKLSAVEGPIVYSSYTIDQPFTSMRALLIEYVVLMVESDETIATKLPVYLWRLLMQWTLRYAQNSIYHAFFYRLVFAVLRQTQEEALRILFQKSKFLTFLMDSFLPMSSPADNLPLNASADLVSKATCRGLIMNCANAIRLQASCMPPSCYVRQFIENHPKWESFSKILCICTEYQQRFGMGIKIADNRNTLSSLTSMMMISPSEYKFDASDSGIDLGSRFAKTLGFYDDIPWTSEDDDPSFFGELNEVSEGEIKKCEAEGINGMIKSIQAEKAINSSNVNMVYKQAQ